MAIQITCACGQQFAVGDCLAGRRVVCPVCQCSLEVPKGPDVEMFVGDSWDHDNPSKKDAGAAPRPSRFSSGAGFGSDTQAIPEFAAEDGPRSNGSGVLMLGVATGGILLVLAVLTVLFLQAQQPANFVDIPPGRPVAEKQEVRPFGNTAGEKAEQDQSSAPKDAPAPAIAPFNAKQAKQHQEAWAKHLGVPVEYTNSIGMKFRLIPPGEFTMGSTPEEIEGALKEVGNSQHWQAVIKSEAPQHKVIVKRPFFLGVNEVTQAQYEKTLGQNPSHFAASGPGRVAVAGVDTARHPVESVSWNDAAEFCAKLSQQEKLKPYYFRDGEMVTQLDGVGYRLPMEAEWEFACRAGTSTMYWSGDTNEDLASTGWFGVNSGQTHAVRLLKSNPFGLYDIHGNVWEWVQDWWEPTYYGQFQEKPAVDPSGPSVAGALRVIRGGGWRFTARGCRASRRDASAPLDRGPGVGFRAALSVNSVLANPMQAGSVAKEEREPIGYQPFGPDRSTKFYAWEGERVVLLTTTDEFDETTMALFIQRLDAGWKVYTDLIGRAPGTFRQHNGKVTIAAIPGANHPGWVGAMQIGLTGIEVGGFYGPQGDYDRVRSDPEYFPDYYFNLMGSNHYLLGDRLSVFSDGFTKAMSHICMEGVKGKGEDGEARQSLERFENSYALSGAPLAEVFPTFGATKPYKLKGVYSREFEFLDANTFFTAAFLKLRKEHGGDDWARRFFRHLFDCPPSVPKDVDGAQGQLLNWVLASSLAAGKDLTPLFRDRWRFPLKPELWKSLQSVDWGRQDLTVGKVLNAIQLAHLPLAIAISRPEFLTPELRKLNLLVGGSFEDESSGPWTTSTWLQNNAAAAIEAGEVKVGQKAQVIRSPIADDARSLQTVTVKPFTRYLVSGWIKTKDVMIQPGQQGGKMGANLSIDGTGDATRSIVGTNDWTYLAFVFDSGLRTAVPLCTRLGFSYSSASGEAWFDDLNLVAIGKSPPGRRHATRTMGGRSGAVTCVAFSPDGKWLASGNTQGIVRVWSASSGQEMRVLNGLTTDVKSVAFSADGTMVVAASADRTVKAWDAANGQETRSVKGEAAPFTIVLLNSDGTRLAWNSDATTIKVCDTTSGQELLALKGHAGSVQCVAFSPDGKWLATAADKVVKVWNTTSGQETATWKDHTDIVSGLAYGTEGKPLAAASADHTIKLWDTTNGRELFTVQGSDIAAGSVVLSPNGRWLTSASPNTTLSVWDAASGHETLKLEGHAGPVQCVAFSADGSRLASGSSDQTVKIWDIAPQSSVRKSQNVPQPTVTPKPVKLAEDWKGWPKDAPPPAIAPFNAEQAKQHQEAWAKHLGVPVEYTNSIGMKFRLIPPGEFMMGSTADEVAAGLKAVEQNFWSDCVRSESPRHKVVLTQPVYFGIHEVTQANYKTVMGTNPAFHAATGRAPHLVKRVAGMDTNQFPVEGMTWYDSAEFCAKLSLKEKIAPAYLRREMIVTFLNGTGYRLPTEAEWEFACRAGTTTMFLTGDSEQQLAAVAWTANNSGFRTHAVGELSANQFGLHDMHGNVWETLQDWWGPTSYTQFKDKSVKDPTGPMDDGVYRVSRGGSLFRTPAYARSAFRSYAAPTTENDTIGFRVTLSVAAVKAALSNPARQTTEPSVAKKAAEDWKGWSKDAPAPAIAPFNAEQAKQHQEAWAKHLGVPVGYTNSIGMKFRLIPPGEFLMGSSVEEIAAVERQLGPQDTILRSEGPQHKVTLTEAFYLGTHEVTQKQFQTVMDVNPSFFAATGGWKKVVEGIDTSDFPVDAASWIDAVQFSIRLSNRENLTPFYVGGREITAADGNGYRLPTEAQWEFACRAGTQTRYWTGDSEASVRSAAWFIKPRTNAVGQLTANPFGLFDVHGNVWELCQDGWDQESFEKFKDRPAVDPVTPWNQGQLRVIRGGHWYYGPTNCRSSRRASLPTTVRYGDFGFRTALSVDAVKAALANPVQAEAPLVEMSGKELRRFEGHRGTVAKAVFSADGKRVLSGSGYPNGDRTMRLWDVETGREMRQFSGEGMSWVFGVALSPDGKLALSGCWNGLRLWDVETGQLRHHLKFDGPTKQIIGVTFSHDGKLALSGGGDGVVRLWDVNSGVQLREFTGHTGQAMLVEFSPDDRQIVSSGHGDKTVRLWNTDTSKELFRLEGHTAGVESVTFTRDGTRLISASVDELILWDAKDGKLIRKIAGDGCGFLEADFFPDGRRVLLGTRLGRITPFNIAHFMA